MTQTMVSIEQPNENAERTMVFKVYTDDKSDPTPAMALLMLARAMEDLAKDWHMVPAGKTSREILHDLIDSNYEIEKIPKQ